MSLELDTLQSHLQSLLGDKIARLTRRLEELTIEVRAADCVTSWVSRPSAEKLPAWTGTMLSRIASSRASSTRCAPP